MRADNRPRIKSTTALEIEGLNQARLLGLLLKEGVSVYSVQRESSRLMRLVSASKDVAKISALCEKHGYALKEKQRYGAVATLVKLLPRLGVIVTLIVLFAAYAFFCGFIWRVEISGNSKVDGAEIEKLLTDSGAAVGARKDSLKVSQLESILRKMDGISEATVQTVGTTLKVSVLESLDYVPPTSGDSALITSLYDAEITRVTVKSGTALVHAGERVFKGAPLISGDVIGTDGEAIAGGKAHGEVYGKVVFTESLTVPLSRIVYEPTGNVSRTCILSLWGWEIGGRDRKFELADVSEKRATIAPFPVTVIELTESELVKNEQTLTEEQAVAEAEEELSARLDERMIAARQERTVTVMPLGANLVKVTLYVAAEIKIN